MTATATDAVHLDPNRRHDAVLLFDVTDGNPNGDPDAGNLPRVDPETMHGLVTDVAIKRKVRDWVDATRGEQARFKIYVQNKGVALNDLHQRAYDDLGLASKGKTQARGDVDRAQAWMCGNFYDVRTFGAVMSTGVNAGQVRGPVQITFARSVSPIVPLDLSITRVAVTKPEDARTVTAEGDEAGGKRTEMGRKTLVPYGLYRANLFVVPSFARRTGFDGEDLAVLWEALQMMWDLDRSASRGMMACRGLWVFSHDNPLGNAPAHRLLDRIRIDPVDAAKAPRGFDDYRVAVDADNLPDGVTLTRLDA
jgi:CRISPR-associated protein Csd2